MTDEALDFSCAPGNIAQNNITFQLQGNRAPKEIIRLDSEGFHYRGQLIEDAGEAHRLFVEFMRQSNDMRHINQHREVADLVVWLEDHSAECLELDQPEWSQSIAQAARFLHLYLKATPQSEPEVPTDDELLQLAREWNSGHESIDFDCITDYAREVLARYGRSTVNSTEA